MAIKQQINALSTQVLFVKQYTKVCCMTRKVSVIY